MWVLVNGLETTKNMPAKSGQNATIFYDNCAGEGNFLHKNGSPGVTENSESELPQKNCGYETIT
jgi:hypothetical protein